MASSVSSARKVTSQSNQKVVTFEWSCDFCTLKNSVAQIICGACSNLRGMIPELEILLIKDKPIPKLPNTKAFGKVEDKENRPKPSFPVPKARQRHGPSKLETLDESRALQFETWKCEKCTLQNNHKLNFCVVCGFERINLKSSNNDALALIEKTRVKRRQSNDPKAPVKNGVKETFEEIVAACEAFGVDFVDDSFCPGTKALFSNCIALSSQTTHSTGFDKVSKWLRPNEIQYYEKGRKDKTEWCVMKDPKPSDICQGRLGDCWLMGSLALIAEREELLNNIVQTKTINTYGAYIVRLNHFGRWTDVIVDSLLPCDKNDQLVFATGKRKQLWVPLIEKAMAKLHGSYEALIGGHFKESLFTLTGFCTGSIYLDEPEMDKDVVWATLISSASAKFLIGAASHCKDSKKMEENEAEGISSLHAYSILETNDEHGQLMLRLRNPWGKQEWRGNYSKTCHLWTQSMKDALKPELCEGGVFWMSFQDFLKHFMRIDICRIRKDWDYNSFQGIFVPYADSKNHPCYSIVVTQPTEFDITLHQTNFKSRKERYDNESSPEVGLILIKIDSDSNGGETPKWKLINYTKVDSQEVNMNIIIDPGRYNLIPISFGHWTTNDKDEDEIFPGFQILIYSSRSIRCQQITPIWEFLLADIIIKVGLDCCDIYKLSDSGIILYHNRERQPFGKGSLYIIENNHSNRSIAAEINFEGSKNIKCTRSLKTIDLIPPKSRQIVNIVTVKNLNKSYRYNWSLRTSSHGHRSKGNPSFTSLGYESDNGDHFPKLDSRSYCLHTPRSF